MTRVLLMMPLMVLSVFGCGKEIEEKNEEVLSLWLKVSVKAQNLAREWNRFDPGTAIDPSRIQKALADLDRDLGKLVAAGVLVEKKVRLANPGTKVEEGREFQRRMETFMAPLAKEYGYYVAAELMDLGLRRRLSVFKKDKDLELRLRLPAGTMKEFMKFAKKEKLLAKGGQELVYLKGEEGKKKEDRSVAENLAMAFLTPGRPMKRQSTDVFQRDGGGAFSEEEVAFVLRNYAKRREWNQQIQLHVTGLRWSRKKPGGMAMEEFEVEAKAGVSFVGGITLELFLLGSDSDKEQEIRQAFKEAFLSKECQETRILSLSDQGVINGYLVWSLRKEKDGTERVVGLLIAMD